MTREEFTKKMQGAYNGCMEKIKEVPVYIENGSGAVTEFFADKRTKFYIALSCFIEAITFVILFFAFWENKKGLAGLFAALAAAGAAVGALFLISSLDEDENGKKTILHFDNCYDEEEADDDISVEIVDEEPEEAEDEEAPAPAEEDK